MPRTLTLLPGIIALSLVFAVPAAAFQETKVERDKPVQVEKQAEVKNELNGIKLPDGMSLSMSNEHSATLEKSFEFQIPGLSEKGVLPKLNFGLELLYSDKDQKTVLEEPPADDVTIRGTLKHRF